MSAALQPQQLFADEAGGEARVSAMDAESAAPLDWSGMLPPGRCHLILNLEGSGVAFGDRLRLSVFPGMAAICRAPREGKLYASRLPGSGRHRCVVLSVSGRWLEARFGPAAALLHAAFREEMKAVEGASEQIGQTRSMTLAERDLGESLMAPPVPRALRPVWFRGKLLECFSVFGVAPARGGEPRQDAIRRRIDDAVVWLREHFDEELDLRQLSRHVGCAPHYLSRLFRNHTGKTLSQKLRQIRIDQAAKLLRDGERNVTEAAFEVGYNSLSHFTKAFVTEKGVRPSDYRGG